MVVPEQCIKWINLQRTKLKDPVNQFKAQIKTEYNEMKKYLPAGVKSILDIGCGLASIDVLLSKHYNQPILYLMDNSEVSDKIVYGYNRKKEYYSCFKATRSLLKANYIKNYNLVDIKNHKYPVYKKIDLVISLLSCGYHYSVNEYLGYINTILSSNGSLILDIREDSDGIEVIKTIFPKIKKISHYNKSIRICARRK